MDAVAIGFWGAFFGTAALMLVGALAAFVAADRRVALAAALTACGSALFALAFLGWLPIGAPAVAARVAEHVAIFTGLSLWLLLMADLGLLREARARRPVLGAAAVVVACLLAAGWVVPAAHAAVYGMGLALVSALVTLPIAVRSARRGDRVAWWGAVAIGALVVALGGGLVIVTDPGGGPWPVHTVAATAGTAYLAAIGVMLWTRYSYLIEQQAVRALGPRYDPITRMQANAGTTAMVAKAFQRQQSPVPVVLVAVSIGNLYALENLHGRAALNHALFVCASRLRRCVPADIQMGRLFDDAFLLLSRNTRDVDGMMTLGRVLAHRLARPVKLRTDISADGAGAQTEWVAQIGVGLLATTTAAAPAAVLGKVRAMSRTAWAFESRVAWQDHASDTIAELPQVQAAAG